MLGVWSQEILEPTETFVEVYSALHRTGNLQSSLSMQSDRRRPLVIGRSDTSDSTNSRQAEMPRVSIAGHTTGAGAPDSKKALLAASPPQQGDRFLHSERAESDRFL